ncbi:MAG: hypothetical protein IT365_07870 [Candidatus Hydrogenedentes bacterium]|nr:hypothetical protein [Candidatus Hydrogenedentota bacterium]
MKNTSDLEGFSSRHTRRAFLGAGGAILAGSLLHSARAAETPAPNETYETQAKGIRILPGQWRPHYPWEHIAWVSPAWPSQDYIWLDFPEAIFTSQGLIFLSHINPGIDTVFHDLPRVAWIESAEGLSFDRSLPNGIVFGGSLRKRDANAVDLELHIRNGSAEPLKNITLQTCAFLRGISEFGDYTRDNKFVHVPGQGWVSITRAMELPDAEEAYRVGWRTKGKRVADVPMAVTVSSKADRLFAFTWGKHTLSMVSNARHPCVHADPYFPDIEPGKDASIRGALIFFEGELDDFPYMQHLTDLT